MMKILDMSFNMLKIIKKFFQLKIKRFWLNRVCDSFCGCATCPFTNTKNTNGCVICAERAKISWALQNLGE